MLAEEVGSRPREREVGDVVPAQEGGVETPAKTDGQENDSQIIRLLFCPFLTNGIVSRNNLLYLF